MPFSFDFTELKEGEVYKVDGLDFAPIRTFGIWQLAAKRDFTQGKTVDGFSIEIPEITMPDGNAYSRGGMQEGGKSEAWFMTIDQKTQTGEDFKKVEIFTTAGTGIKKDRLKELGDIQLTDNQQKQFDDSEKDLVWLSTLSNFQMPAFMKMPISALKDFGAGKPLFMSAESVWYDRYERTDRDTGETVLNDDGKPKFNYNNYYTDFVVYASQDELDKAKAEYEATRGDAGNQSGFAYPVEPQWKDNEETMTSYIKGEYAKDNGQLSTLAIQSGLYDGNLATDGKPVEYKKILSSIVDLPEPMIPDIKK